MTFGLNIIENEMLTGINRAILFDSGLVVSPAIASLLRSEKGDALQRLVKTIRYIDMRKASQGITGRQGGEPSMSLPIESTKGGDLNG